MPDLGHDLPAVCAEHKSQVIDKHILVRADSDFHSRADWRQVVDHQHLGLARLPDACRRRPPCDVAAEAVNRFDKYRPVIRIKQARLRVKHGVQLVRVTVVNGVKVGVDGSEEIGLDWHGVVQLR